MPLTTLQWILLMTSINGLLAFAGIFTLLMSKKFLNKILLFLVAFATGALLGGASFHLLPEAFEELSVLNVILLTIIGFILFLLVEKVLHWHHCHKKGKCEKHPFTYLTLYGDAIHNFIDGLIIASSFIISIPLGILTSILIITHELPQEIGDFAILVYGGFTKGRALFYNFFAQITSIIGGVLGYYFLTIHEYAIFLLPIAAGCFLYIAIMDLIPEIFKEKNKIKVISNLIAITIGLLILLSLKYFAG